MKLAALKLLVGASGVFAAYYVFFLGSAGYDLYGPSGAGAPRCATGVVWSLQGGALLFAPTAAILDVVLWFVGRKKVLVGVVFPNIRATSFYVLLCCALLNLLIFIPVR